MEVRNNGGYEPPEIPRPQSPECLRASSSSAPLGRADHHLILAVDMLVVNEPNAVVIPPFLYHTVMPCAEIVIRVLSAMREEIVVQLFVVEGCCKYLSDAGEVSIGCWSQGHCTRGQGGCCKAQCDKDGVDRPHVW